MTHKMELKHPDYDKNRAHYKIIDYLMGGTVTMREKKAETLPQYQRESDPNYKARVSGTVLYNATRDKVEKLSKKPFSRKVDFTEDIPPEYEFVKDSIDGDDMTIDRYLEDRIKGRMIHGKSIHLVNMPDLYDEEKKRKVSEVERVERKLNPYVVKIHPDNLINWHIEDGVFKMVRIAYQIEEFDGDDVKQVDMIDQWTEAVKETWRKKEGDAGGWEMEDSVKNEIGVVPIVMSGEINDTPEIEDTAWLNLSHFRKQSALDSYLNMACVPFLFFKGFNDDDVQATVSVHNAYVNSDVDSGIEWVELSGASIDKAAEDLERLEAKLEASGADLITPRRANAPTATERVINNEDQMSPLQSIVVDEELAFKKLIELCRKWLGVKKVTEFGIDIFKDFNITKDVFKKLDFLLKARLSNEISNETFLTEVKRLKVFSDDFDPEDEISKIEDKGEL